MAPDPQPFRFFDNREKYLLFTTTCGEKRATAQRVAQEFRYLEPRPPALRVFQAGAGEGSLLNMVLRGLHRRWPTVPFFVLVKENSPEFIRMAARNLADRFCEHPELVLVFSNLRYGDADWTDLDRAALRWRDVALDGDSSHGFEAQLNAAMGFVDGGWRAESGRPSVLVLYRSDQRFTLDRVIPGRDGGGQAYDLILASQPYRSRLPADVKIRTFLAPLALALAPGGRMITIQSTGRDPGMEIIEAVWPGENPFPTPRSALLDGLRRQLGDRAAAFELIEDSDPEFDFRLQLNPDELQSAIGTSTLLAGWNAATYVAQIEDHRLNRVMSESGYLEATRAVLRRHDGLWFNNECFVVARTQDSPRSANRTATIA